MIQKIQSEKATQIHADVTRLLSETFGVAFNVWEKFESPNSENDQWVHVCATNAADADPAPAVSGSVDAMFFNKVTQANEPAVLELTGKNLYQLLIPLQKDFRSMVATASIQTQEPSLLKRMAKTWMTSLEFRTLSSQLQNENEGFVRQVTDDMEELSFLRKISDQFETIHAQDDLASLATNVLELMNCSVKAEQIILAEVVSKDGSIAPDKCPIDQIVSVGNPVISQAEMQSILRQYGDKAVGRPLIENDFASGENTDAEQINSFVLVPISKPSRFQGWILAINRVTEGMGCEADEAWGWINREFGSKEATLLTAVSSMLASHMMNRDLFKEKEQLLTNVVRSLVSAIEAKDQYTRGHSERVALYGQRIGKEIGFDDIEQKRLHLSGLLHDVGKIGISDDTLSKSSKLTEEEFSEIKRHPDEGWAILHGLDQLSHIIPGVLYHHERIDGKGYPDGLKADEIPIDGRILAVADAFDAMTSDRPYRKGMSVEKAVSIIESGAGTQWDSDLVKAFLNALPDIVFIKDNYQPKTAPSRKGK